MAILPLKQSLGRNRVSLQGVQMTRAQLERTAAGSKCSRTKTVCALMLMAACAFRRALVLFPAMAYRLMALTRCIRAESRNT